MHTIPYLHIKMYTYIHTQVLLPASANFSRYVCVTKKPFRVGIYISMPNGHPKH